MKPEQQTMQRSWWRKPTTWLVALTLPAIVFLAGFAARELDSANELKNRLQKLRSTGRPIDNASMDLKYVSSTKSEQSVAWNEAGYAASGWASTMGQDMPFLGNKGVHATAFSKGEWPEVERVDEFLTQLQPVLKRLHETADKTTQPVWQPIHFDGYNTLLGSIQESRSISRLLALDFCYAVYKKDRQRALRDLKSARAAIVAYRCDSFLVQELVCIAHVSVMHQVVGMSLSSDFWTNEDLVEIRQLVGGPEEVASPWQRIFDNELAAASIATASDQSALSDPTTQRLLGIILKLPSVRLRYLSDMERINSLGQNDLLALLRAAEQHEKDWKPGIAASHFAPAVSSVARALLNSEESRRLVITGLALKQFKLTHGEFPPSLEQLPLDTALNITRADISGVDQLLFGYEIDDGEAFAWNTRPIITGWAGFTKNRPELENFDGWRYYRNHYGSLINIK